MTGWPGWVGLTHLFGSFFLQIQSSADDGDGVGTKITAKLTDGRMHGDQFFQLATAVDDTMVGTKTPFEESTLR